MAGTTGPDVDAGLANGFTASRLIVRPLALVALSPILRIGSLRAPCVLVQSGIPSYEGPEDTFFRAMVKSNVYSRLYSLNDVNLAMSSGTT